MKRTLHIGLGIGISLAFLYVAFREVDLGGVWDRMRTASPGWLAAAGLATIYSNWARARRWGLLLRHVRRISPLSLFSSTMVGLAGNFVLPLRLGEAVRAYSISKKESIPLSSAATTLILERVFDMLTLLILLAVTLALVPIPESAGLEIERGARLLSVVGIAAAAGIGLLLLAPDRLERWIGGLTRRLPDRVAGPAERGVHSLLQGVAALADGRQLFRVLAHSLWIWTWFTIVFFCGVASLDLGETHGVPMIEASLATVVFVAIFIMIPAAPGFVGTFQAGCIVALGIFGVPREEALGFSLLIHAVQFVLITLIGAFFFAREGIRLAEARTSSTPPAAP